MSQQVSLTAVQGLSSSNQAEPISQTNFLQNVPKNTLNAAEISSGFSVNANGGNQISMGNTKIYSDGSTSHMGLTASKGGVDVALNKQLATRTQEYNLESGYDSNPLLMNMSQENQQMLASLAVSTNRNYMSFMNEQSGRSNTTDRVTQGYNVNIGSNGANAGVHREKSTINIIQIDGYNVSAGLAGSPNSGIGLNINASKYYTSATTQQDITSNNASGHRVGLDFGITGLNVIAEYTKVKHGYQYKVNYGQMANITNPIGAVMALGQAVYQYFNPEKINVPRFEVMRPDDEPRPFAHVTMFHGDAKEVNEEGKLHLRQLAENYRFAKSQNPNGEFTLHLGDYNNGMRDEVSDEINQARQTNVKAILMSYGVSEKDIAIGHKNEKISPDDKRLNIMDNMVNVKIVSNSNVVLGLQGAASGENVAVFNTERSSPLGEQQYKKFMQQSEIQEFIKKHKIKPQDEEILGNILYSAIVIEKQPQDYQGKILSIVDGIYRNGHTLREAFTKPTPEEIIKRVMGMEEFKQIEDYLAEQYKDLKLSQHELKKEAEMFTKHLAERSLNDPTFQQKVEAATQAKQANLTMFEVVKLAHEDYDRTYGQSKTPMYTIPKMQGEIFERLKEMSRNPDMVLPPNLKAIQERLTTLGYNEEEYKKLSFNLLNNAVRGIGGASLGGRVDDVIARAFPAIDKIYYQVGSSLTENDGLKNWQNAKTNNSFIQYMNKQFEKDWKELDSQLGLNNRLTNAVKEHQSLQAVGYTEKNIKQLDKTIKDITKTLAFELPDMDMEQRQNANLSLKDRFQTIKPNTLIAGELVLNLVEQGHNPYHVKKAMDYYIMIQKNPSQVEQVKQVLSQQDPAISKAVMSIGEKMNALHTEYAQYKQDLKENSMVYEDNTPIAKYGQNGAVDQKLAEHNLKNTQLERELANQDIDELGKLIHQLEAAPTAADVLNKSENKPIETNPTLPTINVQAIQQASDAEQQRIEQQKQAELAKQQMQQPKVDNQTVTF